MRPGNNGKQANTTHNNIFPNTNKRYGFLTLTERGVMGKVDFFKGYTSVEDVCHHLCEHLLLDLEVGPVRFRTFSCTEQKSTKTSDKGKKKKKIQGGGTRRSRHNNQIPSGWVLRPTIQLINP